MRIFSKTLILLLVVAMLPMAAIADGYEPLNRAEQLLRQQRQRTLLAARRVDKAQALMTEFGAKYDSSQSAISAGNTQTVASAFGVTVTAFATGGQSVAWSSIVSAVTNAIMTQAEREAALTAIGGTPLLDAYVSAIEEKKSAIHNFEGQVVNYNIDWQVWYVVYDAHYDWDTHEGASSQSGTHNYHDYIDDWFVDTSLPSFECDGGCGESFITPPGSHWTKCGTAQYTMYEELKRWSRATNSHGGAVVRKGAEIRAQRAADLSLGCGDYYYTCQKEAYHVIRYCDKQRTRLGDDGRFVTGTCNDPYRRCLSHAVDHNPTDPIPIPGGHAGRGPGLYPSDGNTMSPGDTHTADLITKDGGYIMIYWYLLDPGDTPPYGDQLDITYGLNNGNTEVEFSFALPDDAAVGSYKLTAYIYPSSQAVYEYSYTIQVR